MISPLTGCVISGALVKHSLLFSDVRLHANSQVYDTVVLPGVDIGRRCRIRRTIIDRGCTIPTGTVIGEDHAQDRQRGFRVTDNGVVLVTPGMLGQSIHVVR